MAPFRVHSYDGPQLRKKLKDHRSLLFMNNYGSQKVALEMGHTTTTPPSRRWKARQTSLSDVVFSLLVLRPQPVSLQPSMLRGAAYTNSTLSYLYAHWEVERTIALMTQLAPWNGWHKLATLAAWRPHAKRSTPPSTKPCMWFSGFPFHAKTGRKNLHGHNRSRTLRYGT